MIDEHVQHLVSNGTSASRAKLENLVYPVEGQRQD